MRTRSLSPPVCAELLQQLAHLEARHEAQIRALHTQHEAHIRALQEQQSIAQTRLFAHRYASAQPTHEETVRGLQSQVLFLSSQMAAHAYARSCMPHASVLNEFRHGASLRQIALGLVKRSDTGMSIDLFELACVGKKTGTVRLAEHEPTLKVGQFVFLKQKTAKASNDRLRLVQIDFIGQPDCWGAICADTVKRTNLVAMQGLPASTDPAQAVYDVDFWTSELSSWLGNFWPAQAEREKDTERNILRNTTLVRIITWKLV